MYIVLYGICLAWWSNIWAGEFRGAELAVTFWHSSGVPIRLTFTLLPNCFWAFIYGPKIWPIQLYIMLGNCGIYETEEWAFLLGLQHAWDEGYRRIIIETDSRLLIDALLLNETEFAGSIVYFQIRMMLRKDWEVSFHHIGRNMNSLADALARNGISSSSILYSCPNYFRTVLQTDCMGLAPPYVN